MVLAVEVCVYVCFVCCIRLCEMVPAVEVCVYALFAVH